MLSSSIDSDLKLETDGLWDWIPAQLRYVLDAWRQCCYWQNKGAMKSLVKCLYYVKKQKRFRWTVRFSFIFWNHFQMNFVTAIRTTCCRLPATGLNVPEPFLIRAARGPTTSATCTRSTKASPTRRTSPSGKRRPSLQTPEAPSPVCQGKIQKLFYINCVKEVR